MTMFAGMVLAFLVTYVVHSTLLLGAVWLLSRFVARTEAWREALWKSALAGALVTAVVAQVNPLTPLRVSMAGFAPASIEAVPPPSNPAGPDPADPVRTDAAIDIAADHEHGAAEPTASEPTVPVSTAQHDGASSIDPAPNTPLVSESIRYASIDWPVALALTWLSVAALLLARLVWRRVQLARLLRGRSLVTEPALLSMLAELRRMAGLWEPVGLTSTPALGSPLVYGRREICVPERFLTELGADEQRAALAHELAHLARRDSSWLLSAMVLECVFFVQPLHRIARLRLRETFEYRADGWAVRLAGGQLSLARCLAEVASWVAPGPQPALAERVAMAEGGSPLLSRVKRLLERSPEPEPRPGLRAAAGIALVAAGALFAPAVGLADADPSGLNTFRDDSGSGLEMSNRETDSSSSNESEGTSSDTAIQQDSIEVVRLDVAGMDLGARVGAAALDAGERTHWIAYAIPTDVMADQIIVDSESWSSRGLRGQGIADRLGVTDELSARERVIVLARLVPQGGSTSVARLALRDAYVGAGISGRVYWLGTATTEDSYGWLKYIYETEYDIDIRETAVDMIALHSTPAAEAFLLRVIGSDVDASVREQAVEGLAYHPTDAATATLVRVAQTNPDEGLASEAAETLGEIDHPAAATGLRELLNSSGSAGVRNEALESLVERADTGLANLLLHMALNDPDPDLRREAVESMEDLPASVAEPLLQRIVLESTDRDVVLEAVETLGNVGTSASLDVLTDLIGRSLGEEIDIEVLEAIEDFGAEVGEPLLRALSTNHPSAKVRREAMELVLDIDGSIVDGETLLQIALHDDEPGLRRDAVERMEDLPAEEAVRLLRRVAFESGDGTSERQAAETLGDIGTVQALEVLDEIITRNPGESVSVQAVESIAENFSRELALPRLSRIAREHPSSRVRREALEQLSDLGGVP